MLTRSTLATLFVVRSRQMRRAGSQERLPIAISVSADAFPVQRSRDFLHSRDASNVSRDEYASENLLRKSPGLLPVRDFVFARPAAGAEAPAHRQRSLRRQADRGLRLRDRRRIPFAG